MTAKTTAKSKPVPAKRRTALIRTNIVIDRDLVDAVKKRTGAKSAREAVQRALEQAAARFTLDDLRALRDLDAIRPGYDPKDPLAEDRFARSAVAEPLVDDPVAPRDRGTKRKRQ